MDSLETSRIIKAFARHVPECYVRDYRANGGALNLCRGYKELRAARGDLIAVPADTLCTLEVPNMPARTLAMGPWQIRAGWRLEMRKAGAKITAAQRRRIARDLGMDVFRIY